MSYDRLIEHVCPHAVVEEALYLDADRTTIRPLRPIGSVASISVTLDREMIVPSYGVHVPAMASGSKQSPFLVQTGVSDRLVVSVDQGLDQIVVLPSLDRVQADVLADLLNQRVQGVRFSAVGGKLSCRTASVGRGSSLFFRPGSTLASALGFSVEREYRGQLVVPGWVVITESGTLEDRPYRLIVFDESLRRSSSIVELGYTTVREECRRCGGIGVEHDWRYGPDKEVLRAERETLLLQETSKLCYTAGGSNPFHPWIGTQIVEAVGKKMSSTGAVKNLILADIYKAFGRWQTIKRQQEEVVGQVVTDEEFPFRLLSVDIQQSSKDPTVVFVEIQIQNRANKVIQLTRGIRQPIDEFVGLSVNNQVLNR